MGSSLLKFYFFNLKIYRYVNNIHHQYDNKTNCRQA